MALPFRKMGRFLKISAVIVVFFSAILVLRSFVRQKPVLDIHLDIFDSRPKLGQLYFDYSKGTLIFAENSGKDEYLSISFPQELHNPPDLACETKDENSLCLKWLNKGRLEVKEAVYQNARCYNVVWTPKNNGFSPFDCFSLSGAHWYGGAAHRKQEWPVEQLSVPMQPYISTPLTTAEKNKQEVFGPVLERYWFNSRGVGLYIDNTVPLSVRINDANDGKMCMKAEYTATPYQNPENKPPVLRYFVCKASDAKEVHEYMYKKCFKVPSGLPDEMRMKEPMWTSAKFKNKSMQSSVLTYTNEVTTKNFPKGFFEIYGKYFRGYGDYNFDSNKFRNAHQMIGELITSGFEIGTWVTPYMDLKTLNVEEGKKKKFFILEGETDKPSQINWNGNTSLFIDFTNENAVKWFHNILENIQKDYKNTAFIFDGGEVSFFDLSITTENFMHSPCDYMTKYVELANSFGNKGTVKVGYQSQRFPLYIEIPERESSWGYDGGIKSVIPTVLTYGILGYPFINPGPIGGKGDFSRLPFTNKTFEEKIIPDSELYIRWMLMASYLPIMQFSFPPWDYSEEVVKLAHELVDLHKNKVFPLLLAAAKESQTTGMPMIRPIWWVAPKDEIAQRLDCEFLVGDDLLVAPVLDARAVKRDIYLPTGSRWKDMLRDTHHDGGKWLRDYAVKLTEIATFERLKSPL